MPHQHDLLGTMANHKVAANLLMIMMLLSGVAALKLLNIQFFPTFESEVITVSTVWGGASAEDIESGITTPLEQRLRSVDGLDSMQSTSAMGVSGITLEFAEGSDMITALDQVKQRVDDFSSLPSEAERPKVVHLVPYESVAKLLISGPTSLHELQNIARRFEDELLQQGIDKVNINGLPDTAIEISLPFSALYQLNLGLNEIGQRITSQSQDLPAGLVGDLDGTRELRSLSQERSVQGFREMVIDSSHSARTTIDDIADVALVAKDQQQTISVADSVAVVMELQRATHGDSLKSAKILEKWLAQTLPTLPAEIHVEVFSERWQLIWQRIMLLVSNGISGLVLVLLILYFFLSTRVAFWVAMGIPTSFMATLFILHLAGESINMISLFALIMALGIIVDDAIVVGEDAQAHYDKGEDPLKASEGGARRMLAPVIASSLTTIAAFLPLLLVGGQIGNIMGVIPMVIISVIIASLIESFYILPGHLRNAFKDAHRDTRSTLRRRLDEGFDHFRDQRFRPLVSLAIKYHFTTLLLALAILILAIGLLVGGRLPFQFFPSPESSTVFANVRYVAGTAPEVVDHFIEKVEKSLIATRQEIIQQTGKDIIDTYYVLHRGSSSGGRSISGNRVGSIYVELIDSDQREIDNETFMKMWRKKVTPESGIDNFTISASRMGPPSRDLEIQLSGDDAQKLKLAALDLSETLRGVSGVSAIDDDLTYGREQLIFSVSPAGEALGVTVSDLAQQLRNAFEGKLLQIYQQGADEIEVRIQLQDDLQRRLTTLEQLPIRLKDGRLVALATIVQWSSRQGFESLRHAEGKLTATITADVDNNLNNINEIVSMLETDVMPQLVVRHQISYSFEGRSADQRAAFADMKLGLLLGLGLIYLVLAWVFSSYGWPLLVMMAIPLGLTGAILGHWLTGQSLTILSIFGFFGLSGIVVNDSIILVTFYQQLRQKGESIRDALTEAACQRLRAVLLTSLTTIAGLTPLLFETSRQAQFLIPMATSIAFGLAYATVLILFVVPAMLSLFEHGKHRTQHPHNLTTTSAKLNEIGS
ncbi:MAG: efflux RND transporter permease subunit [Gammaproteobacteria bacterium]|nr:efflux RND transporter permease subunit [Gammaproteobacteria bacterium]